MMPTHCGIHIGASVVDLLQHTWLVLAQVLEDEHDLHVTSCTHLTVQYVMEYEEDKEDVWDKFNSEIFDRKVANMVELLKAGHKFRNQQWGGGDAAEPKYM
ncbi:hypothetical protein HID58_080405 [Brassica napus]|uniref:Uncharacterized protein n=3 Tax=Brassica TaxID=3705 RepID=A0ABQ7Y4T2_BRANA|nr:hypothetical protein HID58_080405 [Brassica napus]